MSTDFQKEFVEEAKTALKDLQESLLLLEKDFCNVSQINNVYRYLHTLKGAAGMFGFANIERITHELESVYSDVRDGVRPTDEFLLDLTFHASDVLGDILEGNDDTRQVEKIIGEIVALKKNLQHATVNSLQERKTDKEQAFVVILQPNKNIFKRGINLQNILSDIQTLGNCEFIIHNEETPFEKQLENKSLDSWIEIILASHAGMQEVRDNFMFLMPGEYHVFEIETSDFFTSPAYQSIIQLDGSQLNHRLEITRKLLPSLFAEQQVESSIVKPVEKLADDRVFQPKSSAKNKRIEKKASHISVATQKLDRHVDIVSELVIFRSEIHHLLGKSENLAVVEAMEKLDRLTLALRDSAFNIRLVPLNILNVKLERLIKSVSKELGKEIEFITEGLHTELDRAMISALEAPLMHIIRNAIDHGIEKPAERAKKNKPAKGLVKFFSYNSGDHVFIQIQDDGNGIDFDKIIKKGIDKGLLKPDQHYTEKELLSLMMTPGFSTAEKVTTVSGRGVGLDVVKKDIAGIRGDLEITSEKGLGSIFTLRLPLTLTILDTLVVEVSENKYLIPINEIEYCYKEQHSKLFKKTSRQLNYADQLLPFVSLREYFGMDGFPSQETVIVINKNDTKMAIVVDNIIGELQTVYKPLNDILNSIPCFSGASILGDGSMALILDAPRLKS